MFTWIIYCRIDLKMLYCERSFDAFFPYHVCCSITEQVRVHMVSMPANMPPWGMQPQQQPQQMEDQAKVNYCYTLLRESRRSPPLSRVCTI